MSMFNELEEGNKLQLDFSKLAKISESCPDVLPVAVQNIDTGVVILVAYANERALNRSIGTRTAFF
jgi:phosphoribosyl-AMP cyclohydrolase